MRIYHGSMADIIKPKLLVGEGEEYLYNYLAIPAMYFFDNYDLTAEIFANPGGFVYEYELDLNDPEIKVLGFDSPYSREHIKFHQGSTPANKAKEHNVLIYWPHYSEVYSNLLFELIEMCDDEPSDDLVDYVISCMKAGKVLDNAKYDYLVGERLEVDNFKEIAITDQKVLDKLKLVKKHKI